MALVSYTIVRTFPVPPERLWRGFTDPADVVHWVWGDYSKDVRAAIDLREGGAYEFTMDVSGQKGWDRDRVGMRGLFAEVRPPVRLVHTLHWDAPVGYNAAGKDPVDEVVHVEIAPDPSGSRLSYTHMGIPDDGVSAPEHERSVRATLDLLARRLAASPYGTFVVVRREPGGGGAGGRGGGVGGSTIRPAICGSIPRSAAPADHRRSNCLVRCRA